MDVNNIGLGASLLAGILAFFSPCVLPLLPVYLSIFAGSSPFHSEKHSLIIVNTLSFVLGFSVVFAVLGLSVSAISQYLLFNRPFVVKIAGILVIVLGMFLLGLFNIPFLVKERRKHIQFKAINPFSAFILGCAFALGWTPCIGPVLSSVLLMAGSAQNFKYGFLMLLVFSFGLAVPFLIMALVADRAKDLLMKTKNITVYSQKLAGLMLVIMGILLFLNKI